MPGPAPPAEAVVPETTTIALGEIAESAKEGLLALAVGAGLQLRCPPARARLVIAAELHVLTGRTVSHQTLLRWCHDLPLE